MKSNSKKTREMLTLIITTVLLAASIMPVNAQIQTNAGNTQFSVASAESPSAATPGDADGLYNIDGYYYYYKDSTIYKKTGWVKIDNSNYVKLDSASRVVYQLNIDAGKYIVTKYDCTTGEFASFNGSTLVLPSEKLYYVGNNGIVKRNAGQYSDGKGNTYIASQNGVITAKLVKSGNSRKYYKYANGSMQLVKNKVTTVSDKLLYLFDKNGVQIKKSGWYKIPDGTSVYVNSKGYVTSKLCQTAKTYRYYTFNYKTNKWTACKNSWKKIGEKQYYFANNGIAKYSYSSSKGILNVYSNGRFLSVKSKLATHPNGRLYYYSSSGRKVAKQGWYDMSSTVKIKVSSKGYVTSKFDSKAGHVYTYDYGKKKWSLLKTATYKIGKNTYYFDAKGGLIRKQIAGNSRTGYYYVDSTGCKVTSKEIQTAVNLVMQNTSRSMTREQKLYACFMKIRQYPYVRDYVMITSNASQFSGLALQAMNSGEANCYKYASAFACVATVLGYDAKVICGKMPAYYGSGLTDHGWTQLWDKESKSWRIYDSCLQRALYYNMKISDYFPGKSPVDKTVQLTVSNGKVTWKWVK